MTNLLSGIYDRYRAHHSMDRSFLEWIGIVGCIAFPLFYSLRRMAALPPPYDDLKLRIAASLLCLFLGLRRWWPGKLKPFYIAYSYLTVFYCLSFLLSFTMLKNQGGTPSVVNMVMGAILIILLADWRNTVVMLLAGYGLSLVAFWATDPHPRVPPEFVFSAAGSILVVIAGALSHFGQKRAELERMRLLYSGLAGSIAHEMRSPLMQIRYVLDTANTAVHKTASFGHQQLAELTRTLGQGQDAVTRGLQAIKVILQQLNPTAFDASSFRYLSAVRCIRKAVEEFAYENDLHRSRVTIEARDDFNFKGDETVFILILFNLIKNALYYLPLHPHARVTVTVDAQAGNQVIVRDTGPGIASELLPRLFEEFQSLGKSEGTGLGLAFCKRAMRAFGGDIACHSKLGEFTEFTMSFPEVPEAELMAYKEQAMQQMRRVLMGKRILVVDDETLMRKSTIRKLMGMGCTMVEAADGKQAMEAVKDGDFDLILMDINMPVLDGFGATEWIRRGAVSGREATPIMGFSVNPAPAVSAKGKRVGMNAFLAKDSNEFDLAEAMVQVLKNGTAHPEITPDATLAGQIILLAEDNASNRAIVKARLVDMGVQVIEAEHGQQVLQALEAGARPAAILMDMNMPGLDGLQTTRALRAMPGSLGKTPILVLTGNSLAEDREAAHQAGVNAFLTKPVEANVLHDALIKLLPMNVRSADRVFSIGRSSRALSLLNTQRIEELRQLGILEELLPGCLSEIQRFTARLKECLESEDAGGAYQALHSLLGISGEVGAQRLHEVAKHFHAPLAQGKWPHETDWLAQIQDLAGQTEKAMMERYAIRSAQPNL